MKTSKAIRERRRNRVAPTKRAGLTKPMGARKYAAETSYQRIHANAISYLMKLEEQEIDMMIETSKQVAIDFANK